MEFGASAGTPQLLPAQGYEWRGSCSPHLARPGTLWNNLGSIRSFFSLVQRPDQSILATTSVNRETPTSHCQCSAALNCGCLLLTGTLLFHVFYDTRVSSPWQVLLGAIIKKIKMLWLSKFLRKLLGKTYWRFGFQRAIIQGLQIQNVEKRKLGFESLKASNFRVVLVINHWWLFLHSNRCARYYAKSSFTEVLYHGQLSVATMVLRTKQFPKKRWFRVIPQKMCLGLF